MPRVGFGEWLPDLPGLSNPGLTVAQNVIPRAGGYGPFPGTTDAGVGALDAACLGAIGGRDGAGLAFLFAGDTSKLYKLAGGTLADASKAGGYSVWPNARWEFVRDGNIFIGVTPGQRPQRYNLVGGPGEWEDLNASAPKARHAGIVDRHLVLGNFFDDAYGWDETPDGIWWPAIDNPTAWPEPGTDLAIEVQSDRQELKGNGGKVMAIASGAEVGGVFQEHAVHRMDFVGPPTMFTINRVEPAQGLLVPGLAIPYKRGVFYLAEDGFYTFDFTSVSPVGKEKWNSHFLADLDFDNAHRVTWATDPGSTRIAVAYPGSGNTGGRPNRILIYDWALDRAALVNLEVEALVVAGASQPGTDVDSMTGDVDVDYPISFDFLGLALQSPLLALFDSAHTASLVNGTSLVATLETADLEHYPGRRAFVSGVRPIVTDDETTVSVAPKGLAHDALFYRDPTSMARDGRCPQRADGRYHRYRTTVPAGWVGEAVGLEVTASPTGSS